MNPYGILSVSEDAPFEQIERAWKSAVRRHHPDLFAEAERDGKMIHVARINAAYDQIRKLRAAAGAQAGAGKAGKAAARGRRPAERAAAESAAPRREPGRGAQGAARPRGDVFGSMAAGPSQVCDLDSAEYADLRRNAYRQIAEGLSRRLKRSLAQALTLGLSAGRFSLAPLIELPSFPNAFLPRQIVAAGNTLNIFFVGTPMLGDTLLIPTLVVENGNRRFLRESFHSLEYRGWNNVRSYRVGRLEKEGMEVAALLPDAGYRSIRLFFHREYANPTTGRAIATSVSLSLGRNWLYKLAA
jgi:hypothetical protein